MVDRGVFPVCKKINEYKKYSNTPRLLHCIESMLKKCDRSNNNSLFWKRKKVRASWRHLLLENDVIHGVGQCYAVFTLERRYKYM